MSIIYDCEVVLVVLMHNLVITAVCITIQNVNTNDMAISILAMSQIMMVEIDLLLG